MSLAGIPSPRSERLPSVHLDRSALADNWRRLAAMAPASRTGAAVKADGYGLGAAEVSRVLYAAGCRDFFVAWADEGAELRETLQEGDARIVVLQGLERLSADLCIARGLVPVLSTPQDIAVWRETTGSLGPRPAFLQVETGMNRLGLGETDARAAAVLVAAGALRIDCVMSHLASADETSEQSAEQLAVFDRLCGFFPGVPRSLANSAGIRLDPAFHFDLLRPGIALYGGGDPRGLGGSKPVATLTAAVLQVRTAARGEAAGYGAAVRLTRDTHIATVGLGYADGFLRSASGAGVHAEAGRPAPMAYLKGRLVPILGRVSMDMTLLDVTDVESEIAPGERAEFFGPNLAIDRVAASAGTIAYELLTGMGARVTRMWVSA